MGVHLSIYCLTKFTHIWFCVFLDYNQVAEKKYHRQIHEFKPDLHAYQEAKAQAGSSSVNDTNFYRDANSLAFAGVDSQSSRQTVERLVTDVNKQYVRKKNFGLLSGWLVEYVAIVIKHVKLLLGSNNGKKISRILTNVTDFSMRKSIVTMENTLERSERTLSVELRMLANIVCYWFVEVNYLFTNLFLFDNSL